MVRVAIQGFGRIGRSLLRVALQTGAFTPVAIADVKDLATLGALFEVDSTYGRWPEPVVVDGERLCVGGRRIDYIDVSHGPADWRRLGVELVVDCSGRATTRAGAQVHLDAGARRVLISAASKSRADCDAVLLPGINLDEYDPATHHIVSLASCTTNALAPVVKVLREHFGIRSGLFSTIHAYTNTQSLTDQPLKDRRDSWAATENIIPSSSGAAKALQFIWPGLAITGKAYRVPTRTGSIVELNVITERSATVEQVNEAMRAAAATAPLAGVLGVLEEEWPSARIVGDYHSSIIDLPLTQAAGELLSVAAWYDNEMGYAARLSQMVGLMTD